MYEVPLPGASALLTFLGWPEEPAITTQAEAHLQSVTMAARAYTRGKGFTKDTENTWQVEEDIAAVIVSASARSLNNPTQDRRVEAGSFNAVPGTFAGWTLAELAILHNYRRRAA